MPGPVDFVGDADGHRRDVAGPVDPDETALPLVPGQQQRPFPGPDGEAVTDDVRGVVGPVLDACPAGEPGPDVGVRDFERDDLSLIHI